MAELAALDGRTSIVQQLDADQSPVVLVNVFTVDPEEADALVEAWADDADYMKRQPGFISTQLHRGVGDSATFMNYAVWESVAAFKAAFSSPEFQRRIGHYPKSAVSRPQLFAKVAVPGICTAG